jgi:hypothetical protein
MLTATYTNTGSGSTLNIAISVAPNPGDILIAGFEFANSVSVSSGPSGWTPVTANGTGGQLWVYYKVADGTETTAGISLSGASTSGGFVAVYSGADVPAGAQAIGANTSSNTITAPTIASVPTGAISISVGGSRNGSNHSSTTSGSGWTERVDTASLSCITMADNSTGTGSVTGATFTFSATTTARNAISFYLPLAPVNTGAPLLMAM